MDLKQFIRDVPDFPKPGILFKDITPLLKSPAAFSYVMEELCKHTQRVAADAVVGIESRGFLFGAPLALELGIPFIPVRKAGKLPAERMSIEYSLEYGTSQLDIHQDALSKGQKVVIIDDLLATGGTARAAAKLVELLGAKVALLLFVIELKALGGIGQLTDYELKSLLVY